jgi:hypothetical protein
VLVDISLDAPDDDCGNEPGSRVAHHSRNTAANRRHSASTGQAASRGRRVAQTSMAATDQNYRGPRGVPASARCPPTSRTPHRGSTAGERIARPEGTHRSAKATPQESYDAGSPSVGVSGPGDESPESSLTFRPWSSAYGPALASAAVQI